MASSITQAVFKSGTTYPSFSPSNVNDLLLLIVITSQGGGSPYVTGITDTQGNTWNRSIIGTFGASSSYFTFHSFSISAFYAYASATTANTVTPTFHGGQPGTTYMWLIDCAGVATSSPILTNIYHGQTAPGTGTDAATTAGGVGSDTVTLTGPGALIVGWASDNFLTGNFVHAGSGFTSVLGGFGNGYQVEYNRQIANGTYDATFTLSTSSDVASWMIAISEPIVNTTMTPPVGSQSVSGVAPAVTPATNSVITPFVARRDTSGLIVCERERKIFLPTRRAA